MFCWGVFFCFVVVPFCLVLIAGYRKGQPVLQNLEVDFIYPYSMGRMLNEHPVDQLYNYELQKLVCAQVHPLKTGTYGPIPYPPFIGMLFRPFARLPYSSAYLLWVCVSFVLYMAGLTLITSRFFQGDPLRRSLIFFFALTFYPFLNWALVTGHLSAIGFFAFALAFYLEDRGRLFSSGLVLSICLYKPTLLLLVLPMKVVLRQFRLLGGFLAGMIGLVLLTFVVEGPRVWNGFASLAFSFGRGAAAVQTRTFKQLWKYIDIASFSSALGGSSWIRVVLVGLFACSALFLIGRAWIRSEKAGAAARQLTWAVTLTSTLVLNVYVPIYDSILVVLSAIVTEGVLRSVASDRLHRLFTLVWMLLFVCSWFTVSFAEKTGLQTITIVLTLLGALQLRILQETNRTRSAAA